jgi:hypothetical protein
VQGVRRLFRPAQEREGRKPSEGGVGWNWDALLRIWVSEGFQPETFWQQTERSFAASIEGRIEVREREAEAAFLLAYNTGAFSGIAAAGKLKKFAYYNQKPSKVRNAANLLGMLRGMKKKGTPMTIERVYH